MKHLLNDLTEKEKNSIREQHTGGMKVVTENFSKLINTNSGDVKPLVNEQEDEDYSDLEKEFDELPDREFKDRAIKNVVQGEPYNSLRKGSSSDCEGLIQTMKFIFKDYMDSIETFPDEFDEADAEDIYDELETELGGIIDHANQMDCNDEIIYHLEILYNEYLSDMANKLGLR